MTFLGRTDHALRNIGFALRSKGAEGLYRSLVEALRDERVAWLGWLLLAWCVGFLIGKVL